MKKLFLLLIFSLTISTSIFGQLKALTEKDYELAQDNAHSKMDKIARRVVTMTNKYKNGVLDSTESLIQEYLPPNKEKWESFTKKDGVITEKLQLYYIGDFEYRKEGDGIWQKRNLKGNGSGEGDIISGKEVKNLKQYLVFDTKLEEKNVSLYLFYRVYDLGKTLNFYFNRKWLDSSGLILKEETKESDIFPENVTLMESVNYEYNPKDLKIEAPIK